MAAPQNFSSTTGGTGYSPNKNLMPNNPGISNPNYPGMTSTTNTPPAYQDIGGGVTFGIATPDQYVSTQLTRDIAQNSPYMQLARQSGLNQANSRGMLNSSIAAGASQGAAIQAAMPMAQADAAMLANLQKTNLGVKEGEDVANMGMLGQLGAAATSANASMTNTAASLQQAMQAQRENLAYQGEQAGLTRDWTSQFAGQQQGYAMDLANQNYFNQSGLIGQQGQIGSNLSQQNWMQNTASNLMQGNQNFYSAAGLNAMNNPAIMGNPQAFLGYLQTLTGPFSNIIDSFLQGWGG